MIIPSVFQWKKPVPFTSQFGCWRKFTFILALDENIVSQCRCCGLLDISSESAPKILVLENMSHPSFSSFPLFLLPWDLWKVKPSCTSCVWVTSCSSCVPRRNAMGTKVLTSSMGGSLDPALMVLLCGKPVCRRCWRKERAGELRKVGEILENAENSLSCFPCCHFPAYHWSTRLSVFSTCEEMVNILELCCRCAVQCSWRPLWIINNWSQLWKLSHKAICKIGSRHSSALPSSIPGVAVVLWGSSKSHGCFFHPKERAGHPPRGGTKAFWVFNSNVPLSLNQTLLQCCCVGFGHQVGHSQPIFSPWSLPSISHHGQQEFVLVEVSINKGVAIRVWGGTQNTKKQYWSVSFAFPYSSCGFYPV